jgi:hypothetical protein
MTTQLPNEDSTQSPSNDIAETSLPEQPATDQVSALPLRPQSDVHDVAEEEGPLGEWLIVHVKQEGEAEWRCQVQECGQLFISPESWRRHVTDTHSQLIIETGSEEIQIQENEASQPEQNQEEKNQVDPAGPSETSTQPPAEDHEEVKVNANSGEASELPTQSPAEEHKDERDDTNIEQVSESRTQPPAEENGEERNSATSSPAPSENMSQPRRENLDMIDEGLQKAQEALFEAAYSGDIEALANALKQGADVNEKDRIGITPLVLAIREGNIDAVDLLLERGADPYLRAGEYGPLAWAIRHPKGATALDLVQVLFNHGVNMNAVISSLHDTALHSAAHGGKDDIVNLLVAKGADIEKKDVRINPVDEIISPNVSSVMVPHLCYWQPRQAKHQFAVS